MVPEVWIPASASSRAISDSLPGTSKSHHHLRDAYAKVLRAAFKLLHGLTPSLSITAVYPGATQAGMCACLPRSDATRSRQVRQPGRLRHTIPPGAAKSQLNGALQAQLVAYRDVDGVYGPSRAHRGTHYVSVMHKGNVRSGLGSQCPLRPSSENGLGAPQWWEYRSRVPGGRPGQTAWDGPGRGRPPV